MIEKIILDHLNANMDVEAFMEKENNMPDQYILVEKTGGGETDGIKSATIAVQSIAKSKLEACVLNEMVKECMKNIIETDSVSFCGLNSDYDYTNVNSKSYRYQSVFDIYHY